MTTLMRSAFEITQQGGTQGATTKAPPVTNRDQELRDAAEQLKAAIQKNVSQELMQARAEAAAQRAEAAQERVQGTQPTPTAPPGPFGRGGFTITTPEGRTVIGVPPRGTDGGIPREAVTISVAFFLTMAAIIILLPVARAFARGMDRRSGTGHVPAEVSSQLEHLNQAVDAIALEVERISEGQRFTTRLLTEQRETASLPTGANR
jgi:hypothetical protein